VSARWSYPRVAPGVYQAMDGLDRYLAGCGLEPRLVLLVQLRASQLNGCAYCLDSHTRDLRTAGEREERLATLGAWRDSPWFSDRERAALAWTEAVTRLGDRGVPDRVYEDTRAQLELSELADLTLAVAAINAWNRLSIAARLVPAGPPPGLAADRPAAERGAASEEAPPVATP
jgi:AhpD family alkylhydroperoxidase